MEYDADSHDLRTVSLHVFEDEAMRSGYYHNHSAPFVRVDPENRDGILIDLLKFHSDPQIKSSERFQMSVSFVG